MKVSFGPAWAAAAREGVGDGFGRRLLVGQHAARGMQQAGVAQAVVELARIGIGRGQIVDPPAIVRDADQKGDYAGAAGDADLPRRAGARLDAEFVGPGLARAVGGDGDDIVAVLREHGVDPAVQRGLAVDPAVVIGVAGPVRAGEQQIGIELVAVERDGDALAAPRAEPVAIGIFARSEAAVAFLQRAAHRLADADRLGGDGPGHRDIGGGNRGGEPIGAGFAGPVGGGGDPIGAVGGNFEDDAAVGFVAAALDIVIGEEEAVRPGHHQEGVEPLGAEIELDALPARAGERIDILIFARAALAVAERQLAVDALARREARHRLRHAGRRAERRRRRQEKPQMLHPALRCRRRNVIAAAQCHASRREGLKGE